MSTDGEFVVFTVTGPCPTPWLAAVDQRRASVADSLCPVCREPLETSGPGEFRCEPCGLRFVVTATGYRESLA